MNIFRTSDYLPKNEILGEVPDFKSISRDVLRITWPSMVESFLVSLVVMIDGVMVSSLGNSANAAVTITKQPFFLMVGLINALNVAGIAIIARRFGEKNREGANRSMHTVLQFNIVISLIVSTLVYLFARELCVFMGANSDTIVNATTYLKILAAGFIFNGLRLTINTALRAIGNTKASLYSNVTANVVNMILNFFLITGRFGFPRLEIKGAAIATVIGNIIALMVSVSYILKKNNFLVYDNKQMFKLDKNSSVSVLKLLPSTMLEQAFMRFGFMTTALMTNHLGTLAQYVTGVVNDILSLGFTLADGFSIGISALVGHRLGERREDLAYIYARVGMTISICFGVLISLFLFTVGPTITLMYKPETEEAIRLLKEIMWIAAVIILPQNLQWVLTGVLRGAGDTKFTAKTSLVSVTIVRPSITYILCYLTPLGVYGAWFGMLIDQTFRFLLNLFRFKSKKWQKISL